MFTRTPKQITGPIRKLAKQLVPNPTLLFVPVKPEPGALQSECFPNVQKKIAAEGGNIQHGWQIWEWPDVLIEAEFHAVWASPAGQLIDVTPKDVEEDRILFLPDPNRTYGNSTIDNERRALKNDKLVHDFIKASKHIAKLRIEGETPGNPNETTVDARTFVPLAEFHDELAKLLLSGGTEHSPCVCGSGKKYRNCHGK